MNLNPFGKGKKNKLVQKLEAACEEDRERIETLIQKAEAEQDPASKILKLKRVQEDIREFLDHKQEAIENQANKSGRKAGAFTGSSVFAGGLVLMFAPHLLIAGLVTCLLVPEIASTMVKGKRSDQVREKLETAAKNHIKYLRDRSDDLADEIETVMNGHVPEISKSALHARIMVDRDLAEVFDHASAKHRAEEEAIAEAEEKKAAKKVTKENYGKLIGMMTPEKSAKKTDRKPSAQ